MENQISVSKPFNWNNYYTHVPIIIPCYTCDSGNCVSSIYIQSCQTSMTEFFSQIHLCSCYCSNTAQKMKFSIKDFCSKCNQIRIFLRIWSYLPEKSPIEIFIFLCSVRGCNLTHICLKMIATLMIIHYDM